MTQVFEGGSAIVLRGDAANLSLPDDSIDLIITSPPYFALRSYRDGDEHYDGQIGDEATPAEFLAALIACTREWMRVLKPSGSLFVNLGDSYVGSGGYNNAGVSSAGSTLGGTKQQDRGGKAASSEYKQRGPKAYTRPKGEDVAPVKSLRGLPWRYALRCIDELGLILRAELVWWKPNGLPESVVDRVARKHEQWFHFTLEPNYFSAIDEIREQHATVQPGAARRAQERNGADQPGATGERHEFGNPAGKLPPSVWQVATEPLVIDERAREVYDLPEHFAAFPTEWPRRLILGWSPGGICTACGEGRFPVTERATIGSRTRTDPGNHRSHVPGYEDVNRGEWTEQVTYNIVGYACSCTPVISLRGQRGDWREGREVEPELGNEDYSTPGNGVPRKAPAAVERLEKQYVLEPTWLYLGFWFWLEFRWDPAPTVPAKVLDPFGGTGTVAMVARALGRTGISNDLSADYCRLARWRIFESGDARKVVARTLQDRQGSLF